MPTAEQQQLLTLDQLVWPISFQYVLTSEQGLTQQNITVEAPGLWGQHEASSTLGKLLWRFGLAPASTSSTVLSALQMMCWKDMMVPSFLPGGGAQGTQWGTTAPRSECAVLVSHTGHEDAKGRRRLFLPGTPSRWVKDGMLNRAGCEELQTLARGLILGIGHATGAAAAQWMHYYPAAIDPPGGGPKQVGFRRVNHVRVCLFTERTPDPSVAAFPS